MPPHFRRHYELISFAINAAIPLTIVGVLMAQHVQLQSNTQEIENLRADIATIRLNSLPIPNAATHPKNSDSISATTTASK